MKTEIKFKFEKRPYTPPTGEQPASILFSRFENCIDGEIYALPGVYSYFGQSLVWGIPTKDGGAQKFLSFLQEIISKYSKKLFIRKNVLNDLLQELLKIGILNPAQVIEYKAQIPVEHTLEDLQEDANNYQDPSLALEVAYRHKAEGRYFSRPIYWLNEAKRYRDLALERAEPPHPEHEKSKLYKYDLSQDPFLLLEFVQEFLHGIKTINSDYLFSKDYAWLLPKIAKCPTIEKISFGVFLIQTTVLMNTLLRIYH